MADLEAMHQVDARTDASVGAIDVACCGAVAGLQTSDWPCDCIVRAVVGSRWGMRGARCVGPLMPMRALSLRQAGIADTGLLLAVGACIERGSARQMERERIRR